MQVTPEIVIKGFETTPAIGKLIDRGIAGLEKVCDYIISTRITIARAQGRHLAGDPYRMRIDIRIPGRREIVVRRWSKALKKIPDGMAEVHAQLAAGGQREPKRLSPVRRSLLRRRGIREEPLLALIHRTFDSARRELEEVVERQRGEVKTPAYRSLLAVVEKVFREQGYGFLRTLEGEQVYFHKNSVLHGHWQKLRVGTAVRYAAELGEKGLQASTLEPVGRPGVAESHDQLHELPAPALPPSAKRR